ncbi:MAG: transposase [Nitrospirae bacterium]|nr:transposase [Nitrospirota bacterium]
MARKPRIEFDGAFYHIITRGNQRQNIFKDNEDFLKYLQILSKYKSQYKYFLYAYVLMNNHVHLLFETQETPLSKILQGISQSYTVYFNRRYKTSGHLFQGRYKAILCDKDEYLLSLVKYIHLNPVRAKMVRIPEEYQWSSHASYAVKPEKRGITDENQVLRMFSEDKTKARKQYRAYISDGITVKKEDIYLTIDQRILGNERFADKVMEKYDGVIGQTKRKNEYTLPDIASGIEKIYGITLKQMREKGKSSDISLCRKVLCLTAKEYGYQGKEIAAYICKDPALITRHLRERKDLKGETEEVINKLKDLRSNVNSQA